jgi:ABC-type branched-subunit amino acid transport system substrate-binding protein
MGNRALVLFAAVVLIAAACGNASNNSKSETGGGGPGTTASGGDLQKNVPSDQPGVTDTEIRVGGVVSKTNPLGGNYDRAYQGVQAYFEMINERGGIYGRELKLAAQRDDQLANNQAETQALISQDNVFAVLPIATLLFTGADTLASSGVPAFGWNINQEFTGPDNLFGERGSYICFTCGYPTQPWLAKQDGRTKVGILAYNVAQSSDCAAGIKASFEKWPTAEVTYEDDALTFGTTDFSVQVGKMKDAGVDFVSTCMDTNGVTNLQKELKKQGVDATQVLPNAYNPEFVQSFGDLFEGSYVLPWAQPNESADPVPQLTDYLTYIDKVGGQRDEISMAGWLDADLFYKGLVAAGPEFTQQSVIDAINQMKWDADGLIPGVDWSIAHTGDTPETCITVLKIEGGKFVPKYQEPGKPFVCFDNRDQSLPDQPQNSAGVFR